LAQPRPWFDFDDALELPPLDDVFLLANGAPSSVCKKPRVRAMVKRCSFSSRSFLLVFWTINPKASDSSITDVQINHKCGRLLTVVQLELPACRPPRFEFVKNVVVDR
jgi:hypothetical protein